MGALSLKNLRSREREALEIELTDTRDATQETKRCLTTRTIIEDVKCVLNIYAMNS